MEDNQKKVYDEKKYLDIKLNNLSFFFKSVMFASLPYHQKQLMQDQYNVMLRYSEILQKRINLFDKQ